MSEKIIDNFIAPPCEESIETLFRDEHILLINKPSGLLSLSGKNPLNWDSVHYRLRQDFPTCLMVHRLDFGTSGIMVLALHKAANAHLTKQFQNHQIKKRYIAVLDGHLEDKEGVIDAPISKDAANFPLMKICSKTGKAAQSRFEVIAYLESPARTRVLFTPLTGRTHQLRIHSREMGHPILGCDLYGSKQTLEKAPRLLLHATEISFFHPDTERCLSYESQCRF